MLTDLDRRERMRLLAFVCSFAWADHEVREPERRFVKDLMGRLDLDESDTDRVKGWLKLPPRPEEVDPQEVPLAHRELFLLTAKKLAESDGEVSASEAENLELLSRLLI